ncbi:hypothetical protein OFO01_03385 [Campylobacter sp. JMF_01 NE2]|uniref:hypothetical protein n=1 Tax=unclassified Campylobacter TaxID=2593542 RepID=UPI0022EA0557|nr:MULTISPECIES: hypothetical protein [unclassified Campylobacter]MDA3052486.1 hypothetical protein [Campylobacter sp. JMF_03 NE3]MDA3066819.1 hypothetical protein [Campylobacter sp. JMF_01 NE2]
MYVYDNGVGFDDEKLVSIFSNGISKKSSINSSGSHGNGHYSAFNASNLRFCFYAGKTKEQTIFSMHAILRTIFKGKDSGGADLYVLTEHSPITKGSTHFVKNKNVPNFIQTKLDEIGNTGSIVGIIGFNFFNTSKDNLANVITSAVVKNFFVAIEDGDLEVEISLENQNFIINKNTLKDNFALSLDSDDPKNAKIFYDTYINGVYHEIPLGSQSVVVYTATGFNDTKIGLCRNGMWITDNSISKLRKNDFLDNSPFFALILPSPNTKFAKLIKLAETNFHSKINLSNLKASDKRELENYLEQISDYLRENMPKNNTEKFDIYIEGLDIKMQGDAHKGSQNKGTKTISSNPSTLNLGEFEGDDGESIKKISDFENLVKAENMKNFISKHGGNRANVKFSSYKNFKNLCVGIRKDNGTDPSCDNIVYEPKIKIKSAKNRGVDVKILPNKEAISIGKVDKDEILHLDIEFDEILQECILYYDFYDEKENNE